MDELVRQAMAKWPQVPACYNWLGLDTRGQWWLRDDATQALGDFNTGVVGAKGSVLRHDKLVAFIQRNYAPDERGCWYFQNGPQRVYVELALTPWVWRLNESGRLAPFVPDFSAEALLRSEDLTVLSTWLDEDGWLYANTPMGLGLIHSQDVWLAARQIETGHWAPEMVLKADLGQRFGFVQSPVALHRT
jgi:Protein of unknown function (DUF2946)